MTSGPWRRALSGSRRRSWARACTSAITRCWTSWSASWAWPSRSHPREVFDMVSVYGDIQAKDEYTHPLGAEKHFNESMNFNFFARGQGRGGFLRIGNRGNEGYAEVTLCLYLPGGEVMFNYKRPEIAGNDAFDAGGMRFEGGEPRARQGTLYEGSAVFLREPAQMAEPGQAFRENPHKRVSLDLAHEAVGPVYGAAGIQRETVDPEKEFARAHYEQHMRVRGTLVIDGETTEVDGLGLRGHPWGPRYWQGAQAHPR